MIGGNLRYAIRSLRRNPGFASVAILTLALGIGGNVGMFSILHSIVLKPLPFEEPDRLVQLWHKYENVGLLRANVSPPNFRDYKTEKAVFQDLAAYVAQNTTVTGSGSSFRLNQIRVTPEFFNVLQVQAAHGRLFTAGDGEHGGARIAILSHSVWVTAFGDEDNALDASIVLDGVTHDIVGVLPPDFDFYMNLDIVTPLTFAPDDLSDARRGREFLSVIGRLSDGVMLEAAQLRMDAVADRIDQQYDRGDYGIELVPFHQMVIGTDVRPALAILLGAVGLVLLIACVNLANLLYARAESRHREMALRTAIGATQTQLIKQLLTESSLIALLGGAIGLLGAGVGIPLLTRLNSVTIPRSQEIGIDIIVLVFTVALILATGLVFGIGPALRLARRPVAEALQEGGQRSHGGRRRTTVRRTLIVAEVALATVLLTGSGLMLRSFSRLSAIDPGYDPAGVLSLRVDLPTAKYASPESRVALYEDLQTQVRALPGVTSAGGIVPTPMTGANPSGSFMIDGEVYDADTPIPNTKMRTATVDYFQTMRIPVVAGRTFDTFDARGNSPVVIVDEQFVRRYISGGDAIGTRVGFPDNWSTIVGVVGDVQDVQLGSDLNGHIYYPHAQAGPPFLGLVVRTDVPESGLASSIIDVVHRLDPDLAPFDVQPMSARVQGTIAHDLFVAALLTGFAGVALILAAMGVYGVLSYSMAARANEIGVRAALGAGRRELILLGLWHGMQPALLGAVLGLSGAFVATRWLRGQLFGVSPTDPAVFTVVPAILLGVAVVASLVPVLRATSISPVEALRH